MKIRNGFISNSSSSNFILYGEYYDDYDETCQELLNRLGFNETLPDDDEADGWELREKAREILQAAGYDVVVSECGLYFGVTVDEYEFKGGTEDLCKLLRKARKRAEKLGLEDKPQLIYTHS